MATQHAQDLAHTIAELNSDQLGRSWSLPLPPGAAARTPVVAPRRWLAVVAELVGSDTGRAVARHHGTGIATVLLCAPVLAAFAEGSTGRRITAAVATMAAVAGCTPERMRRARYVLRDLGLAVEMVRGRRLGAVERAAARAHHGGWQTRAASVWHLSVPRGYLSPTTSVVGGGSVGKRSPTCARTRTRTGPTTTSAKAKTKTRGGPRPLHLQRAAAELVAACHGMDRGQWARTGPRAYVRLPGWHIGQIADIVAGAGIDTTVWTGAGIARALSAHTAARGMSWPDRITNPAGFLRTLITGVRWAPVPPPGFPVRVRCPVRAAHSPDSVPAAPDSAARAGALAVAGAIAARVAARRGASRVPRRERVRHIISEPGSVPGMGDTLTLSDPIRGCHAVVVGEKG